MLNKVKNIYMKVKNLIVKCYVKSSNDDSNYYPIVVVSYLGKEDIVTERISPYGLYANPPVNLPGLKLSIFGEEGNAAAIIYSQSTRFKNLKDGEVLIGNEKTQAYIKLAEDGSIEVKTSGTVNIDAAHVNLGAPGVTLKEIARIGDTVKVNVGGTDYSGSITSGGINKSR